MIWAIAFAFVAAVLCAVAVMAIFGITHVAMSGSKVIQNDGLHRGLRAPTWSLPDSSGRLFGVLSLLSLRSKAIISRSTASRLRVFSPSITDGKNLSE